MVRIHPPRSAGPFAVFSSQSLVFSRSFQFSIPLADLKEISFSGRWNGTAERLSLPNAGFKLRGRHPHSAVVHFNRLQQTSAIFE